MFYPTSSTTPDSKKMSPTPRVTTKNEGMTCSKRGTALRQRSVRLSANAKSRAIVSTDSSTSDDGSPDKVEPLKMKSPPKIISNELKTITRPIGNATQLRNTLPVQEKITSSSSEEVDEDLDHEVMCEK